MTKRNETATRWVMKVCEEQWRTQGLIPVGTSELMTAELVIMQQSQNDLIQLVTSNTSALCVLAVSWGKTCLHPLTGIQLEFIH